MEHKERRTVDKSEGYFVSANSLGQGMTAALPLPRTITRRTDAATIDRAEITPILLSKKIPWFGQHTGYQQLPRYLQRIEPATRVFAPRHRMRERFIGKAYSLYRGWSRRNQWDAAAEFRFARAETERRVVRHILHLEEHSWFLDQWDKAPRNIIGTLHLPPDAWTEEELENVARLSSGIVLYRRDLAFFESLVGEGRVRFIPHGVDVEFFHPRPIPPAPKHLLFAGHYLRNTKMLSRVVPRLSERHPGLRFHLLVPEEFRGLGGLPNLARHPAIVWHQRLNDEELRELIASCYLLLLPMNNSGANTAVVEALACGTPIVTTDVGGIRDYGGDNIFPIVPNDDDDAMIALVERYLQEHHWREDVGERCRDFAETWLPWPLIARQHLEIYEELAAG
jgi:glycosyltransferase involved in cell wall biosynthesis